MSNELDIPQVSLGRYLELLKRRWWQVIPVTLFGLIAGAVAAFLIPRYYVAETVFTFRGGEILDAKSGEDPLTAAVVNATLSIPPLAEQAMLDLGWPEVVDEDLERRRNFIEGVQGRIFVQAPQTVLSLSQVNLTLFYRDTNGDRAATFANRIRDLWIEKEQERIELDARVEKDQINKEVRKLETLVRDYQASLTNHMKLHQDLMPMLVGNSKLDREGVPQLVSSTLAEEESNKQDELATARANIAALDTQIAGLEDELERSQIQPKLTVVIEAALDPAIEAKYAAAEQKLLTAQRYLASFVEGTEQHRMWSGRVLSAQKTFEEAAKQRNKSREVTQENPEYTKRLAELNDLRRNLRGAQARERAIESRLAQIQNKKAEFPEVFRTYQTLTSQLVATEKKLEEANRDQRAENRRFEQLRSLRRFRVQEQATVPPRPTDPNILLVAILGSVIGLAAAIGLILLLDFFQSAFKSVDDVERALPIPVLGTIAYLETQEERVESVQQRRRMSLAAGVLLFLSLSVIGIYFVDPTKLPPPVMNLLDMILGTSPTSTPSPK